MVLYVCPEEAPKCRCGNKNVIIAKNFLFLRKVNIKTGDDEVSDTNFNLSCCNY